MTHTTRLRVATRKGLFVYERGPTAVWDLRESWFVGDPVSMVLTDPRNGDQYAALNLGHFGVKLHRAAAGGAWREIAAPRYPKDGNGDGASLEQIWSLAASGGDREGTIWAGTIPGGLFKSEDRGESWHLVESLWTRPERGRWFGGGNDNPGIHSICVDPRNSDRILVAVSCGGVWHSDDGGGSWQQWGVGLRNAYMPPESAYDPVVQDPHRVVLCAADPDIGWMQHHNGIFRTVDGGENWVEITDVPPSVFGFAVAVHPHDPDTVWFVPATKDECRVAVDGKLVVTRSRDGGASFEVLDRGLPDRHCYDLVFRHALDVDGSGNVLAFGSTTGNLWLSEDQGDSWRRLSSTLPPIYAVSFDPVP